MHFRTSLAYLSFKASCWEIFEYTSSYWKLVHTAFCRFLNVVYLDQNCSCKVCCLQELDGTGARHVYMAPQPVGD